MDYQNVEEEVVGVIAETLGLSQSEITPGMSIGDLSPDSIKLFEMLLAFEKRYEMVAEYDEIVNLNTVEDIVKYIARVKYQLT